MIIMINDDDYNDDDLILDNMFYCSINIIFYLVNGRYIVTKIEMFNVYTYHKS